MKGKQKQEAEEEEVFVMRTEKQTISLHRLHSIRTFFTISWSN